VFDLLGDGNPLTSASADPSVWLLDLELLTSPSVVAFGPFGNSKTYDHSVLTLASGLADGL